MSEGPVNFGKPLLWIVILGCAGGGYYAKTHWPTFYEGNGWSVRLPHEWEMNPANDPSDASKVAGHGPLPKTPAGEEQDGVCWGKVIYHGALDWNIYMQNHVPGTPDWTEDVDLDTKKARLFMYEDQTTRYYGAAVDRYDALVFFAIGTNKTNFPLQKAVFEGVVRSIKCQR
ncbi:MAG TPA: hypothetical protein VMU54_24410 [Planctomycetota bacterium]|nr:hypothetical protein [Planctomycetota bacterium]